VRVRDFHYDLPENLIADRPAEPRDSARLLVHDRERDETWHVKVRDLPRFLSAGDLLVLNDTRVLPWRLIGRRATGGRVELLILERHGNEVRGYVKPARKVRIGQPIPFEHGRIVAKTTAELGGGLFRMQLEAPDDPSLDVALDAVGRAPLPPYIRRSDDEDPQLDRSRYQTVYAARPGAVAAPTAGLHFTHELLASTAERGIQRAFVTLHVGEGTFAPVRVEEVERHEMHSEVYELPRQTADAVARTRAEGRRVVAVGTTSARVLESLATEGRLVTTGAGETRLFLYPGRPLRVVDALLTNFHLPESTLLMLVAAFAGRERILRLYREAVDLGYRFYSYGDAMLLL
jgi:S-adenosylmethionine:tRNA ribosyltransferase-isomerase